MLLLSASTTCRATFFDLCELSSNPDNHSKHAFNKATDDVLATDGASLRRVTRTGMVGWSVEAGQTRGLVQPSSILRTPNLRYNVVHLMDAFLEIKEAAKRFALCGLCWNTTRRPDGGWLWLCGADGVERFTACK